MEEGHYNENVEERDYQKAPAAVESRGGYNDQVAVANDGNGEGKDVEGYNGISEHSFDITDPKNYNDEIRRIEEGRTIIYHGLSSLERVALEEEPEAKLLDICADLQAEEEALFSPIPMFIARILEKERSRREEQLANIAPHDDVTYSESPRNTRFSEERRAFVDPGVPLQLPFDAERFRIEHPERADQVGRYHELFFGDPSTVQFPPPENNKRREIEERNMANPIRRGGPPRNYDPPRRKPMKVPHDFVPSCAVAGTNIKEKN